MLATTLIRPAASRYALVTKYSDGTPASDVVYSIHFVLFLLCKKTFTPLRLSFLAHNKVGLFEIYFNDRLSLLVCVLYG